MLHIDKLIPRGRGLARVLLARAPTLELDWTARQQPRLEAQDSAGRALQVTLPEGSVLHHGDVLVATDGSLVQVQAARQAVLQVRHCNAHGKPQDLLRAAHWLGLQGRAIVVADDHLVLLPDEPTAASLRQRHLIVDQAVAPFDPETPDAGTPSHGHGHGHAHEHAHEHAHGHACGHDHDHGHAHGHAHDHGHDHAPDHGHGHAH